MDLFKKLEKYVKIIEFMNDPNWNLSVGEDETKIHFRNKHYHALIDPNTGNHTIHYDEIDPYESPEHLLNHMSQSKKGRKVIKGVVAGIVAYFLGFRL